VITKEVIEKIPEIFFQAMLEGFFREGEPGPHTIVEKILDFPGTKTYCFVLDKFYVRDSFSVNVTRNRSCGQTMIWYNYQPIWTMSYQGMYPKSTIPFLKRAIRDSYLKKKFHGGRGPSQYSDRLSNGVPHTYRNTVHEADT